MGSNFYISFVFKKHSIELRLLICAANFADRQKSGHRLKNEVISREIMGGGDWGIANIKIRRKTWMRYFMLY